MIIEALKDQIYPKNTEFSPQKYTKIPPHPLMAAVYLRNTRVMFLKTAGFLGLYPQFGTEINQLGLTLALAANSGYIGMAFCNPNYQSQLQTVVDSDPPLLQVVIPTNYIKQLDTDPIDQLCHLIGAASMVADFAQGRACLLAQAKASIAQLLIAVDSLEDGRYQFSEKQQRTLEEYPYGLRGLGRGRSLRFHWSWVIDRKNLRLNTRPPLAYRNPDA